MNKLSGEKSAYLRHAAGQTIDWLPWSEKAFEKARQENKPVFLSSGAVWCHWCHVMAKECFYDDDISELLNNKFISIKLDRDERPDIDRRYQLAVAAMGSGGGWPLSVFMTPEKVPFYGGTYFPPEDRNGRPGFKKVLSAVMDLYSSKQDEISDYTDRLMSALKNEPLSGQEIKKTQIDNTVKNMLSVYDPQNGGFGTAPKFPMAGAIDFLLSRYCLTKDKSIEQVIRKTLDSMASGGFYDHIGGGFHRYSTDQSWIIPHFEKMADDNAWLLRNYLSAYAVFGDALYRDVAEGTIHFLRNVLSDPEGGFYASQDADLTPDDEGGYFTWTDEDFKNVLDEDEYNVMALHFLHDAGSMHHDKSKKVLFPAVGEKDISEKTGINVSEVVRIIGAAKKKLLRYRSKRETPFIDRAFYTSMNGMLISVFLHGARILKDRSLHEFALKSLDRILGKYFVDGELYHTGNVRALLDDYVHIIDALIAAYETTGKGTYISQANDLMRICIEKLWDKEEGGFFDTDEHLLGMGLKGIEDIPHPSANSLCVMLFLKLHAITGEKEFNGYGEKALKIFSEKADEMGIHGAYYYNALDAYFNPLKLTIHANPESPLSLDALSVYSPHTVITYEADKGYIVPCIRDVCYEPLSDSDRLKDFLYNRNQLSSEGRGKKFNSTHPGRG